MVTKKIQHVFLPLILVFVFCEMALPQGQSEYALIQLPVLVDPPDTVWKMNKSDASSRLGTQLFIDQVSAALSFVMTPPPSYQLWSGVSFHLDNGWNRVLYLECMDSWIRAFGDRGSGTGQFLWPGGIDARALCGYCGSYWCYSDFYYIYVADGSNDRIIELRYNWQLQQMEWLQEFTGGGLDLPKNLDMNNGGTFAFNDNDYLWVVNGQQIKRFSIDGVLRNTYGYYDCNPNGVGNFCRPTAVACGRSNWLEPPYDQYANDNRIYVADNGNHRLVLMEKDAVSENITWIKTLSVLSDANIVDLEVDNFGQVWAADKASGRIYKYTSDLYPLCYYGSFGTARNEFNYPGSISNSGGYLGGGNIYVTESWTDSSGGQYFAIGTDIVDFQVTSSVDYLWHYISYVLVDPSDVTIEIYDEQDQLVKTLFDATEYSGACLHVWDATDQSGQPVGLGAYRVVVTSESGYWNVETNEPVNVVVKEAWLHHSPASLNGPSSLVAWQSGPGRVTLNWQDNDQLEDAFAIYCDGCLCGSVGANVTTYVDSGLVPGRSYMYWVRALYSSTESSPSNADTVFVGSKLWFPSASGILPADLGHGTPFISSELDTTTELAIEAATVYPGHAVGLRLMLRNTDISVCGFDFLIKVNPVSDLDVGDIGTENLSVDSILIDSDWVHYPVRECRIDTSGSLVSCFSSLNCRGQVADTALSHCQYLWVRGWTRSATYIPPSPNYRTLFRFGFDAECIPDSVEWRRQARPDVVFGRVYDRQYSSTPFKMPYPGQVLLWWSVPGDANNDSLVSGGDIVFLMDYLYYHGPPPCIPESGDPNADCEVTAGDIVYLISYLYRGGDPPLPGCWYGKED